MAYVMSCRSLTSKKDVDGDTLIASFISAYSELFLPHLPFHTPFTLVLPTSAYSRCSSSQRIQTLAQIS